MLRVLVPLLALPLFIAQDKKCDLKTVRDGQYCEKCKKALKDDELTDKEFCKICGQGKPVPAAKCAKVKVCDKEWVPKCGMHEMAPHAKPCCGSKMCCKLDHDLALVEFKCAACGAKARDEASIKHDCKDKKAVPVCSKSETFPHGGEPQKPK